MERFYNKIISMKKVFLVYPPSEVMNREGRCQQPVKELMVIPPLPPTELMYLGAIAKKLGFECKIKDYSIKNESLDDLRKDLEEFEPDYILLNVATPSLKNDLKAVQTAKEVNPDIITVVIGAYFLTYNKEILEKHSYIDLIIRGESEYTFKEILEGKEYKDILGLTYRAENIPVNNDDRPFIDNLDELLFPARDLVDNTLFKRPDNNKMQAIIKVARGCPFHCFFCLATPVSGKKVRLRSPENIVAEMRECVEKYKINNFIFWSDIFNLNRQWVVDLCNTIIDSGLKVIWSSNTRADTADFELAKLMYKAGCRLVSIGVESGSQDILNKMGKKITLSQAKETVQIFKKAKIKIYNYFVLGLPWETEEDIKKTIDFAIELDSDFVSFYTATVLPGSRFFDYVIENKLGDLDDESTYKSAYYYPSVNTHYLSRERVMEFHKLAMKRFYLRPSYIIKKLLGISSFAELTNYIKAGLSLIFR